MPNEEAIKVLEMVEAYGIADRAKRAAIRALKNEQTDGSSQKEIDFWHIKCTEYEQTIVKMAVELNNTKSILWSANQTNGDLVIENTNLVKADAENADKKGILEETVSQSLVKDGDLISRQAVIDIVEFECGEWVGLAKTIVKTIEQLPSAEKTTINHEKTTITDTDLIS
jgi:hypothetical protein